MQPTIVNNVETLSNLPWIVHQRRRRLQGRSGRPTSTGMRMFAVSGHVNRPGRVRGPPGRHHLPPPVRGARVLRRHPRPDTSSRRSSPAAPRRRGSSRSTSTCPLDKPTVDKAGSMLGLGCHRRHGRDHRHGEGLLARSCGSSPGRAAASARRAARAPRGSSGSCAASSTGTAAPSDLDLLLDICDNISPGVHVAAAPDDHLRARPLGGVADRLGRAPLPPRVRGLHQRRQRSRPGPRRTRTRCWPMSDAPEKTTVSFTLDGKELEAEPGRADHRRGAAPRRLHPALLLPRAHGAGRHVPHVPGRHRHRPRPGPRRQLHGHGRPRA